METGIVGLHAPPLEDIRWIDEDGAGRGPLSLAELGQGFRILYFFQDWCAGCHAHGFPTFVTLAEKLRGKGVSAWRLSKPCSKVRTSTPSIVCGRINNDMGCVFPSGTPPPILPQQTPCLRSWRHIAPEEPRGSL
ncbi:hypothetical protein [Mesorhizobium sp. WSM2239]